MKLTKAISMFVSVVIGATVAIPIGTTSANDEKIPLEWDGTADTTWYDGEEKEQHISSPSELAGLAVLTSQGRKMEGQTIILDNDISLKKFNWTSISGFGGTFDGNNHTIYGMKAVQEPDDNTILPFGLFGSLYDNSIIQNKSLEDILVKVYPKERSWGSGGIASGGGTIKDCTVTGSIE